MKVIKAVFMFPVEVVRTMLYLAWLFVQGVVLLYAIGGAGLGGAYGGGWLCKHYQLPEFLWGFASLFGGLVCSGTVYVMATKTRSVVSTRHRGGGMVDGVRR